MANNMAVIINGAQMVGGVPEADFTAILDDGRTFSTGASIPFGTGILAANLLVVAAAKAAALNALTPPPVFDGTSKFLIFGGIL